MSFDVLDSPRLTRFHRKVTVLSAAGTFLDGFDLTVIAVALPFLIKEWGIHPSMIGLVAASAVIGMLALNLLPQPYHPVFNVDRFGRASTDKFFLCIESRDPKFNLAESARFLQSVDAQHVTEVKDEE